MAPQTGERWRKVWAFVTSSGARTKRPIIKRAADRGKIVRSSWRPAIGVRFTIWINQHLRINPQHLFSPPQNASSRRISGVAEMDAREKQNRSCSQDR